MANFISKRAKSEAVRLLLSASLCVGLYACKQETKQPSVPTVSTHSQPSDTLKAQRALLEKIQLANVNISAQRESILSLSNSARESAVIFEQQGLSGDPGGVSQQGLADARRRLAELEAHRNWLQRQLDYIQTYNKLPPDSMVAEP